MGGNATAPESRGGRGQMGRQNRNAQPAGSVVGGRDSQRARQEYMQGKAPETTLGGRENFVQQMASGDPTAEQKFVAGYGEGGGEEALQAIVGALPEDSYGSSPFRRKGADKRGFYEQRREEAKEVPGSDAVVEAQQNAPAVGGGEPGVGLQGFGSRALVAGEGEVITPEDPQSMDQPVDGVMSEVAQSDVGIDPNYVEPSPGQAVATIGEQAYNIPINDEMLAFVPGSRNAMRMARGPISRNLMAGRSGFGRKI